jgi:ribonuclease D
MPAPSPVTRLGLVPPASPALQRAPGLVNPPILVDTARSLADLCVVLAGADRYGVDTEFHLERTYFPHAALIQVAWADQTALIDPLGLDLAPLAEVLRGPGLAVLHAADQDLSVLDQACGAVPARMFDTQIAAGFLGMSTPSLARLVERLLGISLLKADRLTDWTRRPLTGEQVTYAAGDVAHLLALHTIMVDLLQAQGRLDWAEAECAATLAVPRRVVVPEQAWWKMRDHRQLRGAARGVAQEVAAWRERRAAERDVPRRVVLADLALSAIAQHPPMTRQQLQEIRGMGGRHLSTETTDEILQAVRRGRRLAAGALCLPPDVREERANPAVVALAVGVVRQMAGEQGFDTTLLATRADVADLVAGVPGRLDRGWRRELVGDPLRRLLGGELALAVGPGGGLVLEERSHRRVHPSEEAGA